MKELRVVLLVISLCSIVCVMCASLSGCYSDKGLEGLITAKKFEPAHDDLIMMPMTTTDANGNMTTTLIPMFFHEPDRWVLTIEPYDKEGNPRTTKRIMVTEEVFFAVNEGEWFKMEPGKADRRKAQKTKAGR